MRIVRGFVFLVVLGLSVPLLHAQDNSAIPEAHLTFTTIDVPGAVISNAVANAIGVRVSTLPLTPDRVLAALEKKGGSNARI